MNGSGLVYEHEFQETVSIDVYGKSLDINYG